MSDISEPALAKALAKLREVAPNARKVETIQCDVSKEADVQRIVEHVDSWGGVDVMFNNAGIMHAQDADAIETPEKIWDLTMSISSLFSVPHSFTNKHYSSRGLTASYSSIDINVKGVWYGSKHAVLSFRRHNKKHTSVVNTASVVALVGSATPQLAYTASKGAVLALTRELAITHAKEGFRFNALCPAPLKYVSPIQLCCLSW